MEEFVTVPLAQFSHPFTYIIAGGTQCGKTTMVKKIIQNLDTLVHPILNEVRICFKEFQPAYDEMKKSDKRVCFSEGIDLKPTRTQNTLIVIDDQMSDSMKDKEVQELFTSGVHHRSISVIFLSQNLYPQGKYARDIRLNTHYISICKTPLFSSQLC
jgi:hypothetical protein